MAEAETAKKPLVMALVRAKTDYYGKWTELIYTEVFRRLGMEFVIKEYPMERANVMLDTGQIDGDLVRSPIHHEAYPGLVRVEESPFSINYTAFAADPTIQIDAWESLRDTPYRDS